MKTTVLPHINVRVVETSLYVYLVYVDQYIKSLMKFQFCKNSEQMLDLISVITYDSLVS